MTFRRARAAIGLGAVTAVAMASSALALNLGDAGGISYRASQDHAAAGHVADARTPCPKGKSPTGGGFQTSALQGYDEFLSAASKPYDGADADHRPDNGWEVRGETSDHGFIATAFAMCAKGTNLYRSKQDKVSGADRLSVSCPVGTHVTGGGGSLAKPKSSSLIASFPFDNNDSNTRPDDGWEAWSSSSAPDKLRVFAVCSKHLPKYHHVIDTLNPGEGKRELAFCRTGNHLLGVGGVIGDAPDQSADIQLAQPDDFDRNGVFDDAGAVFAENSISGGSGLVTVYAICTR